MYDNSGHVSNIDLTACLSRLSQILTLVQSSWFYDLLLFFMCHCTWQSFLSIQFSLSFFLSLDTHTHTHSLTSPHKLHIIGFSLTLHWDWFLKFLNKEIYDKKLGNPTAWTSHPQHSSIRLVNVVEWSLIIWSQYSEKHKKLKTLIEQCQPRNLH